MFSSRLSSCRLALGSVLLFSFLSQISGLNVEYCSDVNTASTAKNSSVYQSNGLCYNFCIANYAFAVLQDDGCWCSNLIPSTTTTGCDEACPGYPDDMCGGPGLYGYIALNKSPSGTAGGGNAASSTTGAGKVTVTVTPDPVTPTTTPPLSSTSTSASETTLSTSSTTLTKAEATTEPPDTTSSTPSKSTSSTWTPTPVTSLETVTGQVRTVTVTPTVPPNSQNDNGISQKKTNDGGLSTGGAVGLTIGLVAAVGIAGAVIYFCLRRRRQEKEAEEYRSMNKRDSSVGLGGQIPSRTMSENSRYVLGTDGRQVVETWEPDRDTPGSRRSRLMPVDPRLDPFAPVYQRGENKSRESINTIRDDHDYSRRVHQQAPILRATNPDE